MTLIADPNATDGSSGNGTRGHSGGQGADTVLEVVDVVKEYPGSPPVRALDGVSISVERGELAAIVGPSGSGKSTLLSVIGTLDRPTSGTVVIDGHDVSGLSDKWLSAVRSRLIGFVFQQFYLLDGIDAIENVATGLLYTGMAPADRRARAVEALQRVGLGHRLHHVPNQLSGGERQRVAIARAVVNRPAVVLADEPTGNLDSRSSASILDLLHELHAEGTTILVITHDLELGDSLPRQIVFRDGRIERDTTLHERLGSA
jgi:putative ABC transport system ATP-binding protein